jgi:DNA-binding helix-hairpin-helix protein with protein kinase domain
MEISKEAAIEVLDRVVKDNPLFARVLDKIVLQRAIAFYTSEANKAAAAGDIDKQREHQDQVILFEQQLSKIKDEGIRERG